MSLLTQDAFTWSDLGQACKNDLITPAIAGGDQGAIRLEISGSMAKILTLAFSNSIEELVQRIELLRR